MQKCKLCLQESKLQRSHIIPEFLYENLYGDTHSFYGITGKGTYGRETLQKGLREELLCFSCEQFLNNNIEKSFKRQWVEKCPLPSEWKVNTIAWINVNYTNFKLFHLSVLYRAHISSLGGFKSVNLGPHAEVIRQMILDCNPGSDSKYPILGCAILDLETQKPLQIVSSAQISRINGTYIYGMIYGGVEWWICVASHRIPSFEKVSLRSDGKIPIGSTPIDKLGSFQNTWRAYMKRVGAARRSP